MSTASTITISETLQLLDGKFSSFASGIAEDRYALWLGSAISFDRFPGLKELIPKVLERLRSRVDALDPNCQYKTALESALSLAGITKDERARCDFVAAAGTWPDIDSLATRLLNQYSRLLQLEVPGETNDYLVWEGIEIVPTFADPAKTPDVEHLCVAILLLEGVSTEIASANWDGLIEKAVQELADNYNSITVYVRPQDFQGLGGKANLYKFHGCAIKARDDEPNYRPFITATQAQINRWAQDNVAMADRLTNLIVSKPTLMIGLSAQDPNIQSIFSRAEASAHWPWPGDRPSYVFSASALGPDQKGLLQNVYRHSMTISNRAEIADSAAFPAYAKPLLLGLILHVLSAKLKELVHIADIPAFSAADKAHLEEGIAFCRDIVAAAVGADHLTFVRNLITVLSKALGMFHTGQVPTLPTRYLPLTSVALQHLNGNVALLASGIVEAAIAIGVIGILVKDGKLAVRNSDPGVFGSGALCLESTVASGKLFFAANSSVALRLQNNGLVTDSGDTIMIHSLEMVASSIRSPKSAPGRTGRTGLRETSISTLVSQSKSVSELVQLFRMEVGI